MEERKKKRERGEIEGEEIGNPGDSPTVEKRNLP